MTHDHTPEAHRNQCDDAIPSAPAAPVAPAAPSVAIEAAEPDARPPVTAARAATCTPDMAARVASDLEFAQRFADLVVARLDVLAGAAQ